MTNKEKITKKAVEVLEQKPEGIRYSVLVRTIADASPDIPLNTINGTIWSIEAKHSQLIYKPARGLFDSKNPKDPRFKILTRAARHEPDMFYVNKHVREVADELLA